MIRTAWSCIAALSFTCAPLLPDVAAQVEPARRPDETPALRATYRDAALAFQRLDAQFVQRLADRDAPPPEGVDLESAEWMRWTLADPEALRRLNADFDRATFAFFRGDLAAVVQAMNAMMLERPGSGRDKGFAEFARSLRIDLDPAHPTLADFAGEDQPAPIVRARLGSIYPLPPDVPVPEEFSLVVSEGERSQFFSTGPLVWETRDVQVEIGFMLERPIKPGRRDLRLRSGPLHPVSPEDPRTVEVVGHWTVLPEPVEASRARLEQRLEALAESRDGGDEPLAQRLLRERTALLKLIDSHSDITALLTDFAQLIGDLDREWAAVAAGVNPYMGRSGDTWHGLPLASDVHLPARIFVPESALARDSMPLLIALHGAGGNENLFIDGYGAGAITRLAEEHGFAVVSPLAAPFMDLGLAFDAIVDAMKQLYSIDESRIYVIGHSLGAAMAGGMCSVRNDRITAACWLAGASYARASRLPPTLVIAAELDSIVPPARIEPAVNLAKQAGLDLEYRLVPDFGHTLVVGFVLGDVVEWLLAHRLD